MTRILLTGGSGFIAAHVLDELLARGHSVVTTVRTQEKGDKIRETHRGVPKEKLDFAIVKDISRIDAFDEVVISNPPFEAVVHTASPFHFKIEDVQKDLLDPAVNGTVSLLTAVKRSAPSVKRVVITSSFASIINVNNSPGYVYSEDDWNPITKEQAVANPMNGYRASKTFAEKAAWDFVEQERPKFTLSTLNPPLVLGPIVHHVKDLNALNTSNERIRDLLLGERKNGLTPTGVYIWVDVRDLALAHALAAEKPEAAGQRYFITAGKASNREMAEIVWDAFPEFRDKLPTGDALKPGDYPPEGTLGYNNNKSVSLGVTYRPLKESIVDAVNSLKPLLPR